VTSPLFFGDPRAIAHAAPGDELVVDGDEGRHAVTVKRLAAGEPVLVADGAGVVVEGVVTGARGKDELIVEVREVVRHQSPSPHITVVQALIKGERMERAIEAMTEAGVDRIVLWQAQRAIVRLTGDGRDRLVHKLRSKAQQAAKQARRAWVPVIEFAGDTEVAISSTADSDVRLALHEQASGSLAEVLPATSMAGVSIDGVALIVGPEGGISPAELDEFAAAGVIPVRMGPEVLRSSTAGTVALGWVMGATGRWTVGD
jgi:16S rRNA (uracil1498-N3)-methyltransferase